MLNSQKKRKLTINQPPFQKASSNAKLNTEALETRTGSKPSLLVSKEERWLEVEESRRQDRGLGLARRPDRKKNSASAKRPSRQQLPSFHHDRTIQLLETPCPKGEKWLKGQNVDALPREEVNC
jgi:hypothetical protein